MSHDTDELDDLERLRQEFDFEETTPIDENEFKAKKEKDLEFWENELEDTEERSIEDLMNEFSEIKGKKHLTPEMLKEIGLDLDTINDKDFEGIIEELQKQTLYAKERMGFEFSFYDKNTPTLRSLHTEKQIEKLADLCLNIAEKKDQKIIHIPCAGEFNFNERVESSKYTLSHIAFDIEADKHSTPILCQGVNPDARRVVVTVYDPSVKNIIIKEYEQNDGSIFIYSISNNLNDCVLLTDAETIISTILLSALHQGQKNLTSLFKKIPYQITLRPDLLKEILKDQRRSSYTFHNAKYDVRALQYSNMKANHKLNCFNAPSPEKITIHAFRERKEFTYQYHIGNKKPGFRYNLYCSKMGLSYKSNINIAPHQEEALPMSWLFDTLNLGRALQQPDNRLQALSKGTQYEKIEHSSDFKVFSIEDFPDPFEEGLTEALEYGIFDVYATLSVYDMLSNKLDFSPLEKILKITIEDTISPRAAQIFSAASLAKIAILAYLMKLTGLSEREILKNIEQERSYQINFEKLYLGAKNDVPTHGLILASDILTGKHNLTQEEIDYYRNQTSIIYADFASLYPHAAWLSDAEAIFYLAAKGELHNYIFDDVKQVKKNVIQSAREIKKNLLEGTELIKESFSRLSGTCSIRSSLYLQIPSKGRILKNSTSRRFEIQTNGKFNLGLHDLVIAIVRYSIDHKLSIKSIMNNITFYKAEILILPEELKNKKYGEEFFSRLYIERELIKIDIKKRKLDKKSDEYKELSITEQWLKYIMNSSYGVTAEGISNKKLIGKFFVPAIAFCITGISRALTSIAQIRIKILGGLNLYTDTDSVVFRIAKKLVSKIFSIFPKNVCKLKDEVDDKFPGDAIKVFYIASKKRYAYLTYDGNFSMNSHGKSQYYKQPFENALEAAYRNILEKHCLNHVENAKIATKNFEGEYQGQHYSIERNISFDNKNKSEMKTISQFFNKEAIKADEFEYSNLTFFVYYNPLKDNYLVTTLKDLRLGIFGRYLTLPKGRQKHRLTIFITAPMSASFDQFCNNLIDRYYNEGSDIIFKREKRKSQTLEKWTEFYYLITDMVQEFREGIDYTRTNLFDPDIFKGKTSYAHYWRKLCKEMNLDPEEQLEKEGLYLFEKLMHSDLDNVFNRILPNKLRNKISNEMMIYKQYDENYKQQRQQEFYAQELPIYKMYSNIISELFNSSTYDILEDLKEHPVHFKGLEHLLFQLKKIIDDRTPAHNLMSRYFTFNQESILRIKTEEQKSNNYSATRVLTIDDLKTNHQALVDELEQLTAKGKRKRLTAKIKRSEDVIKSIIDQPRLRPTTSNMRKKVGTDGFSYSLSVRVPKYPFSAELKNNERLFKMRNILNTATSASKIYYATHNKKRYPCFQMTKDKYVIHNDELCKDPDTCKYFDIIRQDKRNLLTPKTGKTILVPLQFKIKPRIRHDKELFPQDIKAMNPDTVSELLDKKIIEYKNRKRLYVANEKQFLTWELNEFKNEWQELNFANRIWSVSVEKASGTNYNATLNINIVSVDKRRKGNGSHKGDTITASLNFNPCSFNLINFSLFNISIQDLEKDKQILANLLIPLFKDTDLHIFMRNQSVTLEDAKEKSHFNRSMWYLLIVKQIIKQHLDNIVIRMQHLTITKQREIKTKDPLLFMSLLQALIIKKNQSDLPKSPKALLEYQKNLMVAPHKASDGISISNFEKGKAKAVSIYLKNSRQLQSKVMRVGRKRQLNEKQMGEILSVKTPENVIRYEICHWGLNSFVSADLDEMFENIESLLKKLERFMCKNLSNSFYNDFQDLIVNIKLIFLQLNQQKPSMQPPPIIAY